MGQMFIDFFPFFHPSHTHPHRDTWTCGWLSAGSSEGETPRGETVRARGEASVGGGSERERHTEWKRKRAAVGPITV